MSFSRWRTDFCGFVLVVLLAATGSLGAQEKAQTPPAQEEDPLNRPLTEKQRKEQEKRFKKEVSDTYKKWLDEEVRWIITGEEMQAFKQLSNDDERDQFIEQFWLRRDPTPDTIENESKEEHYRRIVYANERFAAGKPGWRTDRGRIYIMFGPPDQIESHAGGTYQRPYEEGGGSTSAYPFEKWRYRYIEAIGEQEVEIEFVDTCMCGAYDMEMDRSKKDALLNVPGAGLTLWEEMGMASKTDRFSGSGLERLGTGLYGRGNESKQFDRLLLYSKLNRPPPVKFKDLQEAVTSKIRYNLMPFEVRADFVKLTSENVLMPVTIQLKNKDVTFVTKEGIARGTVNILGQVRTMTGRIVQTFEDTVSVDVPAELLPRTQENASVYWKAFPLRSGRYRLDVVVKDVNGDRMGSWTKGILVPTYDEEKLAHSTLILADVMERVSTKTVGSGNFVIGDTKVRPRVDAADGKPATFKRDQALNLWMQVYNLGIDEASKKANATFEYEVVNTTTNQTVVKNTESTQQLGNTGQQVTLEKKLSLAALEPGTYQLTIKVNDTVSKQQIAPTAKFIVQ